MIRIIRFWDIWYYNDDKDPEGAPTAVCGPCDVGLVGRQCVICSGLWGHAGLAVCAAVGLLLRLPCAKRPLSDRVGGAVAIIYSSPYNMQS